MLYLRRSYVGKKAQPAHIHANDGVALVAYPARCLEKRSVAPHGDDVVGLEVIALEHPVYLHVDMQSVGEKLIEFLVYIHLCLLLGEEGEDFLYRHRLLGLVDVAEDGESQFFLRHSKEN